MLGLDWLAAFGLPGVDRKLKVLSLLDLPDELQKKVNELKAGTKQRRRSHPRVDPQAGSLGGSPGFSQLDRPG